MASAGAIAVAAGPLIGGLFTTYLSWRYVFVGEVLAVVVILVLARRMRRHPAGGPAAPGSTWWGPALSALGLGLAVYGVLAGRLVGPGEPKPAPRAGSACRRPSG